jgi:hypothetical protein
MYFSGVECFDAGDPCTRNLINESCVHSAHSAGNEEARSAEEQAEMESEEADELPEEELNPDASAEMGVEGVEVTNVLRTWRQFLNEDILKVIYLTVKATASAESLKNFRVRKMSS